LAKIVREDVYFDTPGVQNTESVADAVVDRIGLTGIKYVVVATSSGKTALSFARRLKGVAQVIAVASAPYRREWGRPWPCLDQKIREELEELGTVIVDRSPYVFHNSMLEGSKNKVPSAESLVRDSLYFFGDGLKVAVEVILMAVQSGYLEPYQDVIGVGGTSTGADTAVIARATYPATVFSEDPKKRLEIREVIALPQAKR
jgi:hypothetical protein